MKKHWIGLVLSAWSSLALAATAPENMSHEILRYINQYRQSQGLSALKMSDAVSEEATRHSREMALHQVPFGHTGFSGRIHRVYDRVSDAEAGAENVAYNYKTARIVVDGSPPLRFDHDNLPRCKPHPSRQEHQVWSNKDRLNC